MKDYLHEGIDLENTKIVWSCEDCGKEFEDDRSYESYICPYCGSSYTTHEHLSKDYILNNK
jgi:rRNA maturation endonuclease Nob1